MPIFTRTIGIDYSGAETPTMLHRSVGSCLALLSQPALVGDDPQARPLSSVTLSALMNDCGSRSQSA